MKRILRLIVVGVGLMQLSGFLAGSFLMKAAGSMSGASPLPLVFDRVGDVEYWAADYRVALSLAGGERLERTLTAEDYARLPGPHVRHMAYAIPLSLSMVLPKRLWEPQLRYGFCGPLARHFFETQETVERVSLQIAGTGAGERKTWDREFSCEAP
ncbi:MAG TPA: hypothetical protein VFX30_06280 [bacterium]|nr:hypothetical protein [bacterium]